MHVLNCTTWRKERKGEEVPEEEEEALLKSWESTKLLELLGSLGGVKQETKTAASDLAAAAKMSESAVSHQLRILRTRRLVSYRREGRNVYYGLADSHIVNLYRQVAEHLDEEA